MSEPYVGEIRMFAGNFAPQGWSFCNGSSLSISNYETLFQLIGTTYGGDGQYNFNLPNLQGRVPIHQGTGSDGINYVLAQVGGAEQVTLTTQQLPSHNHPLAASANAGDTNVPLNGQALASTGPANTNPPTWYPYDGASQVTLNGASIGVAGGNQPHTNVQPTLAINFIIALFGIFPQQA